MKKKTYVVRVTQTLYPNGEPFNEGDVISDAFIECLRYAGVVVSHALSQGTMTQKRFDILPPAGISNEMTELWAETNADRMRSFGFNAVAAPNTR